MQWPGSPTGAGGEVDSCSFLMVVTNVRRKDSLDFPHSGRECPRLLSCLIAQLLVVVFQVCRSDVMFSQLGKGKTKAISSLIP